MKTLKNKASSSDQKSKKNETQPHEVLDSKRNTPGSPSHACSQSISSAGRKSRLRKTPSLSLSGKSGSYFLLSLGIQESFSLALSLSFPSHHAMEEVWTSFRILAKQKFWQGDCPMVVLFILIKKHAYFPNGAPRRRAAHDTAHKVLPERLSLFSAHYTDSSTNSCFFSLLESHFCFFLQT